MHKSPAPIGTHYLDIETPALLVDMALMERNLERTAAFFATATAKLRPHVKTHRSPHLAHLQMAAGAFGMSCGNLAEAELMIDGGIDDVLVTKEIVQPSQIARVAELAQRSSIKVIVDDPDIVRLTGEIARANGATIEVLVDVDLRLGRSGVQPGEPARALAHLVANTPGLRFVGLMGYEGSMHPFTSAERDQACRDALAKLMATSELIERDGLPVPIRSCGATSTYHVAANYPGITEVQPGSYMLSDAKYRKIMPDVPCALSVLVSVVSRPSAGRVTVDAGQKALYSDGGLPVPTREGLSVVALNEEHGQLDWDGSGDAIRVGDRLSLIPWHAGTTINLYDFMYGIRDQCVAAIWPVFARSE